jgi:hypothetical protein
MRTGKGYYADDPEQLDYAVAQHPHELITYGGNGAVFSKLGTILINNEIPVRNDRRANIDDSGALKRTKDTGQLSLSRQYA